MSPSMYDCKKRPTKLADAFFDLLDLECSFPISFVHTKLRARIIYSSVSDGSQQHIHTCYILHLPGAFCPRLHHQPL